MPKEYSMSLLSQFNYSYEHVGAFLRMFSQPAICDILLLFEKNNEMHTSEIHDKMAETQDFLISKSLSCLKNAKKIEKIGKTYRLKNDLFFSELADTTKKLKQQLSKKQKTPVSGVEIRSVSSLFSDIFFDDVCNILTHILDESPRNLNEVEQIYRQNHGYLARGKVRYYLAIKNFSVFGKKVDIFDLRDGRYELTPTGKKIHALFDKFIYNFQKKIQERISEIWNTPVGDLVQDRNCIVYLRDPLHKVLRSFGNSEALIAFSNEPEGIITKRTALNSIGKHIQQEDYLEDIAAKDVMNPLQPGQILKKDKTLFQVFSENDSNLPKPYYVVNTGGNTFGMLNLHDIINKTTEI